MSAVNAPAALPFFVEFGRTRSGPIESARGAGLGLCIPVLAGDAREQLFPDAGSRIEDAGVELVRSGELVVGCVTEPVRDERSLAAQTQALYGRVLAAARGQSLYRIWNYVPRINELSGGFENYRAFCKGRSLAFEAEVGAGFPQVLPSASAVGTHDGFLSVIFVAGSARPHHFENPEQVPAYRYPPEHGPRSPSFSRATVVDSLPRPLAFISGTAAIKGHQTVAPHALDAQLDCTLDNLCLISKAAGLGDDLGASRAGRRFFKVYLRRSEDLAATRSRLEAELLRPADHVIYLQADICRAALDVEIEISFVT